MVRRPEARPQQQNPTRRLSSRTKGELTEVLVECQQDAALVHRGSEHGLVGGSSADVSNPGNVISGGSKASITAAGTFSFARNFVMHQTTSG
jgi:hypothetical protein